MRIEKSPLAIAAIVAALVIAGGWLRLSGTDWDGFAFLNPDERHLVFMLTDMLEVTDRGDGGLLSGILDGAGAAVNPRTIGFFNVYGDLPLLAMLGLLSGSEARGFQELIEAGRTVTALIDTATILAVFFLAHALCRRIWPALGAAAVYALAPTALQLANFYASDTWLVAGYAWCLLGLVALPGGSVRHALAAGVGFGLALACKITGAWLIFPALLAVGLSARESGWRLASTQLLAGLVATLVTLRLASPFLFDGLLPAASAVEDFRELFAMKVMEIPPTWQWEAGYPAAAFLRDFTLFGLGPAGVALLLAGVPWMRGRALILLVAFVGVLLTVLFDFVSALRYAAPALPAGAALAALALSRMPRAVSLLLLVVAGWWGAGAVLLHDGNHPRLDASRWIWAQDGVTVIANESAWDEGLPVAVSLEAGGPQRWPQERFTLLDLDITGAEDADKAARIASMLAEADLVAVSSGRQSEQMPRLPERFPLTTAYYRWLETDACIERVWHADRGYPLPGLRLDDAFAQEPWRVYDHPIVSLYAPLDCYDAAALEARLLEALR
ncbi:glycosyltransferase family 39 protein [Pelagovum pacificum]|nr:glycosyltransferase family 39 protein [Pelagovum pacificum]QQA43599.1 glycosyltransferase family 39 protein [Pelagovum pacificum]